MKCDLKTTFVAIAALVTPSLSFAQDDDIIWLEYPEEGAVLGQGYDLLNGRVTLGTCVDFVPVQDPSQVITYKFQEVNSTTEVASKTQISASGSMKMAILNASARLSFLSDEKFSLNTSKFLLTAQVTNSSLFAAPSVGLKKGANVAQASVTGDSQPATDQISDHLKKARIAPRDNQPELFRDVKLCGQGYVAAVVSGAAVDAFLTMSKSNAESLANIKGGLEADIASVFKVSGSFEQQQSSKAVQDSTSISVFRYGGATGNVAYDLPALKQSLQSLVTDAASQPKPVRIGVVPYSRISTDLIRTIKADDYSQAISAYFLAKDIMDRTSEALKVLGEVPPQPNKVRVVGTRPIYYAQDLKSYDDLFTKAQRHASRISNLLAYCRQDSAETNDAQLGDDKVEEAVARVFGATNGTDGTVPLFGGRNAEALPTTQNNKASIEIVDDNKLQEIFDANVKVLQKGLPNKDDPSYAKSLEDRLNACRETYDSATGKGAYLSISGFQSVNLLKEELMIRPLYWAEISQRYRERISRELDKAAVASGVAISSLTANQITTASQSDFEEFHTLFRASKTRRGICDSDLGHPVCLTDSSWSESAKPNFNAMEFDAQQLLIEVSAEK